MSEAMESEGAAVRFPPPLVPVIGLVVGFGASYLDYKNAVRRWI